MTVSSIPTAQDRGHIRASMGPGALQQAGVSGSSGTMGELVSKT